MKIIHIITGLKNGGAENLLYKICRNDCLNNHVVISITSGGKYFLLLRKIGIKVYSLDMKFYSLLKFFYLILLLRKFKPDIVQTWLVHGDFVGGLASKLAGVKNIIWTILYSKLDISIEKISNILLIKVLSKLSYIIPKSIVVVSKNSKKNCIKLGYDKKKINLIPIGFDLSIYKINKNQRLNLRKMLEIKREIALIGIVARFHPVKDHENLLNALSNVVTKNKKFCCILVGPGTNKKNKILFNITKKLGLENYVKLLGPRNNISEIMNALDVNILCSKSEGFPNVVAEAMACGTPCIVTDVGDSALIVGKTGWVVPPKNSEILSSTIEKVLDDINKKNWKKRCFLARERVKKKFEINKMIDSYNLIWKKAHI
tara:strand:- start:47 stop:1165 length:1119 start_codon:yes stop_codon:yes gene_type:complete